MDKMTFQQRQQQCERDNAFNALREKQIQEARRKNCSPIETPGKYSKCCSLSPIAPPPLNHSCPCEPAKPTFNKFCTKIRNICETVGLTSYGKEFDRDTGKMVQNCTCVKFNGLQDSCRHPQCYHKIGCMDNPFPNCPPAQTWKREFYRNHKKTDEC